MGAKFAFRDEVVLFRLSGIEFERERVTAKIVERVTESRCPRCIDGEHVLTIRVTVWKHERRCFEFTTCC